VSRRFFHRSARFLLAIGVLSAVVTAQPEPVRAQGLFETLFSVLGGRRSLPEEDMGEGPYQAYCVRLCDGRFFPLPASSGKDRERERGRSFFFREYRDDRRPPPINISGQASPDNLCKAMCPATAVKIFSGTQIGNATAGDGTSYAKLQNAFVYREKMIPECSCNGVENTGVANLDAESDPTLRPGDIIVTADGPKVYRGVANNGQPTPASFVPVKEFRGMSERERKNLSEMRITRAQEPVTGRTSVSPSPAQAPNITVTPAEDIMSRGFAP